MEINLKIKRILIVNDIENDKIIFIPDLPTTFPKQKCKATLRIKCQKGYAREYLKQNFPNYGSYDGTNIAPYLE